MNLPPTTSPPRDPHQPPDAPRPVTAHARRRSWGEPGVRAWVVVAVIVLGAAIGVLSGQFLSWYHDTRLRRTGDLIDVYLIGPEMDSKKGEKVAPGGYAYLRIKYQGKERVVHGRLPALDKDVHMYEDGTTLPMRINPQDADDWTLRVVVPPLSQELIGAFILMPLGVVAAVMAFAMRKRILRVWREGVAREVVVLGAKNTALAPRSQILRCANVRGSDKTLFNVLVSKQAALAMHDTLWVVSLPHSLQPALPVAAYE